MPERQPIRPLFVSPNTTSSYHKPMPNPPNKRNSNRSAPRAWSVSPVDTSFEASISTADDDEYESASSSSGVSPIEDLHRPLRNQFPVQGKPLFTTTALENNKISYPSVAPLAHTRSKQAYSTNEGSSPTSVRSQDDKSRKYPSSKVNNISSMISGINDTGSTPGLMKDPDRRVAPFADHRGGHDRVPDNTDTHACTQNTTAFDVNRSQGIPPLFSISKQIIQVGSNRQTPSADSSKRSLETTIQDDQSHTRRRPGLNKSTKSAEGAESQSKGPADITQAAALAIHTKKGISQPRYSDDKESKDHGLRMRPAFEMRGNKSGKSIIVTPQDGQSRAPWNRSHFVDQPPSRFSDTSCSTTTFDSPPSTPEKNFESRSGSPSLLVVSRKRPVQVPRMQSPNTIRRKPTPSEAQRSLSLNNEAQGTEKPLPKSPPEAQAITRVASLEAKLEALRRRRSNLQTVVNELTSVTQRSPIAYDAVSRQKLKKTIEGISNEISGVGKEEHETGLQLHRAWKREEQTSTYENSSLWVKRLAS